MGSEMASENVERLRRGYNAYMRGELDEIVDLLDQEVELHEEPDLPDARIWHGREGVLAFFAEADARWREVGFELDEIVELGDQAAVVTGTLHGVGAMSGVGVETPFAHLWEGQDGKVTRVRFFFEKEKALAAARAGSTQVDSARS
jgi:ketosteroid isomerase-like protein